MTTHLLHAEMLVERPIDQVFAFFARPENLGRVTPRSLGFELRSTDTEMRERLEVDYRVRPLLGLPLNWRSLITEYDPPHGFRDIQLKGPYRSWDPFLTPPPPTRSSRSEVRRPSGCAT